MSEEAFPSVAGYAAHTEGVETEAVEETTVVPEATWRKEESAAVTTAIAST